MRPSDFEREWHEFADADAQLQAPSGLLPAVMAAWDTSAGQAVQPPPRRRGLAAATALAAAIMLVVVATAVLRDRPHRSRQPDRVDSAGARAPEVRPGAASGPVVTLVADARLENEPLQIVRVRLPRTSLEAFGITLVDSEISSLVEVDVVVGSDGLPRAIQHIGPVPVGDRQ